MKTSEANQSQTIQKERAWSFMIVIFGGRIRDMIKGYD